MVSEFAIVVPNDFAGVPHPQTANKEKNINAIFFIS